MIQFDAEVRVSEQNQQFHTGIPERSYLTCSKIMARICCDLVKTAHVGRRERRIGQMGAQIDITSFNYFPTSRRPGNS